MERKKVMSEKHHYHDITYSGNEFPGECTCLGEVQHDVLFIELADYLLKEADLL